MINQLKKYLNALYETARTDWNTIFDRQTKEITKAIRDKEYETINPNEISEPIVEAQKETTQAIKEIQIPPVPDFPEIPEVDFSELSAKLTELKDAFEKKDLSVNIGKTKVNVDTDSVVKAIKGLEKNLDKLEQKEITDYTLMLDELMKILEKPFDFTEIKKIKASIDKLATTEDLTAIAEWLKAIYEKEYPKTEFEFNDGRLKVEVDRVGGGGGGGLTQVESVAIQGAATEETLQASLGDYRISDIEDPYYGYAKADGSWYIMKLLGTEARYVKGDSDYTTAWTNRATPLGYNYFFNIF